MSTPWMPARVLLPFALGYFVSYGLRNINSVIAPDLTAELSLDAGTLGALTAAYFLAFSLVQLPLGVALDRYGPRRVESVLLVVAAAGAWLFSVATTVETLSIARAVIGVGVAACLMASLKAATLWFSPARQPLAIGCVTAFGGLGALTATAPVEAALELTDWRGVFRGVAVFTLLVAVCLFFVVPRRAEERGGNHPSLSAMVGGIATVLRSRRFRHIAPMVIANAACFMAIQGLWAGPWMADVAGLGRDAVATQLFTVAAAMVAGFFGLGLIADRLGARGYSTLQVAAGAAVITICANATIAFTPALGVELPLALMWVPYGFFGTCGTLFFPAMTQGFAVQLSGRAVTTLNVAVFGGAFAMQWGLGEILDGFALPTGGYAAEGYTVAFGLAVCLQLAAFAWLIIGRAHLPISSHQV